MSLVLPKFEHFDQATADGMVAASSKAIGGLAGYIGISVDEMGPGTLSASVEVRDELLTPLGSMHGGVMAALCDHILGCVMYPIMLPGYWAATTEFKLNYLAPVRGGTAIAHATVVSMSKSFAVVRMEIENEGRLVCAAQGTVTIKAPRK